MDFLALNQKIIIKTSLFGVIIGIISVLGLSQQSEPFLLTIMIISTSIYLYKNLKFKHLLHSIIIGLSWGIDCTLIQILFFKTFILNNPTYNSIFIKINYMNPKLLLLFLGIIIGLGSGLCIFSLIYLLSKLRN